MCLGDEKSVLRPTCLVFVVRHSQDAEQGDHSRDQSKSASLRPSYNSIPTLLVTRLSCLVLLQVPLSRSSLFNIPNMNLKEFQTLARYYMLRVGSFLLPYSYRDLPCGQFGVWTALLEGLCLQL